MLIDSKCVRSLKTERKLAVRTLVFIVGLDLHDELIARAVLAKAVNCSKIYLEKATAAMRERDAFNFTSDKTSQLEQVYS